MQGAERGVPRRFQENLLTRSANGTLNSDYYEQFIIIDHCAGPRRTRTSTENSNMPSG